MNSIAKVVAPLALAATLAAPLLFLFKAVGDGPMKVTMLVATIAWFIFSPFWMKGGSQ